MMSAGRAALWILVLAVFATASCTQACVDFSSEASAATSDCPVHQKKDCCKHENPNSGSAASAATHVSATKAFVAVDHRTMSASHEQLVPAAGYHAPRLEQGNSAVHAIPLILRI